MHDDQWTALAESRGPGEKADADQPQDTDQQADAADRGAAGEGE